MTIGTTHFVKRRAIGIHVLCKEPIEFAWLRRLTFTVVLCSTQSEQVSFYSISRDESITNILRD